MDKLMLDGMNYITNEISKNNEPFLVQGNKISVYEKDTKDENNIKVFFTYFKNTNGKRFWYSVICKPLMKRHEMKFYSEIALNATKLIDEYWVQSMFLTEKIKPSDIRHLLEKDDNFALTLGTISSCMTQSVIGYEVDDKLFNYLSIYTLEVTRKISYSICEQDLTDLIVKCYFEKNEVSICYDDLRTLNKVKNVAMLFANKNNLKLDLNIED